MAQQTINVGTAPNDGTGTPLRTAFQYTNSNFSELYTALGGGSGLPGASTQVLFNNGTNIAGDAGLVYNSTTDALTIGGNVQAASATITGALTAQGTQVKLSNQAAADCTVLIGPDTPSSTRSGRIGFITSSTEKNWFIANNWNVPGGFEITQSTAAGGSTMSSNPTFRINNNSDFLFLDGAGGTRMTLNSTGLGVGGSPTRKLSIVGSGNTYANINSGDNTSLVGILLGGSSSPSNGQLIYDNTANSMALLTAGNTRLTIDSSGNVGIGVTPSAWSGNYRVLEIGRSGNAFWGQTGVNGVFMSSNALLNSGGSFVYSNTAASTYYTQNTGRHEWYNAPSGTAGNAITFTQAMTLDANGNLLLGTPTLISNAKYSSLFNGNATYGIELKTTAPSGTSYFVNFFNSSTVQMGVITGTGTTVSYVTSSDYRLKEDVKPLTGALNRVACLKPSVYKWKADGSSGEGFLAHELAEVVPLAVNGEKDAVNEDGSVKPQGVDYSKVVPVLVAAIQELTARVQTLETR